MLRGYFVRNLLLDDEEHIHEIPMVVIGTVGKYVEIVSHEILSIISKLISFLVFVSQFQLHEVFREFVTCGSEEFY